MMLYLPVLRTSPMWMLISSSACLSASSKEHREQISVVSMKTARIVSPSPSHESALISIVMTWSRPAMSLFLILGIVRDETTTPAMACPGGKTSIGYSPTASIMDANRHAYSMHTPVRSSRTFPGVFTLWNLLDSRVEETRPFPLSEEGLAELRRWHARSGLPRNKFVNTSGQLYRQLGLKDKLPQLSDEEFFALLATDGMLVKRPILITEKGICPGFKPEIWQTLLD